MCADPDLWLWHVVAGWGECSDTTLGRCSGHHGSPPKGWKYPILSVLCAVRKVPVLAPKPTGVPASRALASRALPAVVNILPYVTYRRTASHCSTGKIVVVPRHPTNTPPVPNKCVHLLHYLAVPGCSKPPNCWVYLQAVLPVIYSK